MALHHTNPYSNRDPDTPSPRLAFAAPQTADGDLVLVKNGHRYVFRCAPGDEPDLLRRLSDLARDPQTDLTWFDAAVLSHQVGQRISRQLGSNQGRS